MNYHHKLILDVAELNDAIAGRLTIEGMVEILSADGIAARLTRAAMPGDGDGA